MAVQYKDYYESLGVPRTASEAEIKQRIDALRGAGYTQFTIQLVPGQEAALADWGRIRRAFG